MVWSDRRLTIRMIVDNLDLNRKSVRNILLHDLGMRKVCAKLVPKILSEDQKQRRVDFCKDMLEKIRDDPNILYQVITGDETWVFQYDPETKRQSMQWKITGSPRPKKARMSKLKIKVMLIAFFDQKDLVHHEFVPEGETVNQYFCQKVLIRLHGRVLRIRRALWSDKSWLLHHDNAPAHNRLSVRQLLVTKQGTALDHPTYSPDLAPCDFWLFPQLKIVIKGTHFSSSEEIKASVTKELKSIKEKEFAKCFRGWQDRMQKCIN